MKYIPYGRQCIDEEDTREVVKVLRSDWITQGPKVQGFEEALARYCGAKYAVAVSSGTAALHIACLVSGLKKGDEAITSPITFLATPNSILYAGAKAVFADINYETVNIDPQEIEKKITQKTKAILPVHFAGMPCDIEQIAKIAKKKGLIVIEDACHAFGAQYKSNGAWIKVGSCVHSDMTAFSFHPVKHITTGEGGAITTNNKRLYERLRALRSHGVYKDKRTSKNGPWYYEMRELGFNYRITDIQCALGLSQFRKVSQFLRKRKVTAEKYSAFFKNVTGINIPETPKDRVSAHHLYVLKIDYGYFGVTRVAMAQRLNSLGIGTQVHYIPIYRQPYYRKRFGISSKDFPRAEEYYRQALSLPIHPGLKDEDTNRVIKGIKDSLKIE